MAKRLLAFLFLGAIFTGCSPFINYDSLYEKGKYLEAYSSLDAVENKASSDYELRLLKVVLRLSLEGEMEFITNRLVTVISNIKSVSLSNYILFGNAFLYYFTAEKRSDLKYYQNVTNLLVNLPGSLPPEFVPLAYKIRAISKSKLGNFQSAIGDYENSYSLLPLIENYYFIAECYYALDQNDKCIEYLDRVISQANDPALVSLALYRKGEITYDLNDYETALKYYLEAVKYHCNNSEYNLKIAKCFQKMGYQKIFTKFLKICLRIDENNANAFYLMNVN